MTTSNLKLLRCARLDQSDVEVFEQAAEPGEWAIPGSFEFMDDNEDSLTGKRQQAFASGFLGLTSFGRSTLVSIAEVSDREIDEAIEQLTRHLLDRYGAPDTRAAAEAAKSEINYAVSLCEYEAGTLIAVERRLTENGIEEKFKRFVHNQVADWEEAKPISLSDLLKHSDA